MKIRPAVKGDIAALSNLARKTYAAAFGHSLTAADLAHHLETHLSDARLAKALEEDVVLLAEEEGGCLIGFLQFGPLRMPVDGPSPEDREIRRLYVLSEAQNRGVGTRLMKSSLAHPRLRDAPSIYLDVWERNDGAIRFYRRYGFEIVGSREFATASGAAADRDLVMVRRKG